VMIYQKPNAFCHSRESGNPVNNIFPTWIPAFAGMTQRPNAEHQICSSYYMIQIIPSILVSSEEQFLEQIQAIKPVCSFVQIDIADGIFCSGKTWIDPDAVKEKMDIDFELHMMVANPLEEIERWNNIGRMKRIIFHYESVADIASAVEDMQSYGRDVCVCLNPDTPIHVLEPVIGHIESVQFMSVYPGKQGQSFLLSTLDKIREFHAQYPHIPISDDGAVNTDTIHQLIEAGATRLGPGSAIWQHGDPAENYKFLVALMEEHEKYFK